MFVKDRTDPFGMGMFSQDGRSECQKYIVFQKIDEIMHGKK